MPLSSLSISLVGGPPWGFRITQEDGELPIISQVLPEGRADKEGIRPGDIIDGVNGEDCAFAEQIHNKMRTAQGVLRLRLKRLDRPPISSSGLSRLQLTLETEMVSTPESSAPPTPSSVNSANKLNAAAKPPLLSSYNGGMKGSAQDKKRYFEAVIAKQSQPSPSPIKQEPKKVYGSGLIVNASSGPPSESGTEISGYDSVSGDYYSNSGYDRQTPLTSTDTSEDCWYRRTSIDSIGSKTPTMYSENFESDIRENSATPLAIELYKGHSPSFSWKNTSESETLEPNGYLYHNNQIMHDTSTDSGLASNGSTSTPPAPPPPSTKKWQIKVDDVTTKSMPMVTSVSTGRASGEVEIPRPQSVAELRAQIATKLEIRNPAGQKAAPMNAGAVSAIVHQPMRPQHGKLTPAGSLLSLDHLPTNNNIDLNDSGSNFSAATSPMASTSSRQFYGDYSPTASVPGNFMGYDRGYSPCSMNETASDFGGVCSNNSTLKRQHSRLLTSPEVQHAILLHPGVNNLDQNPIRSSISMMEVSQPIFSKIMTRNPEYQTNGISSLSSAQFTNNVPEQPLLFNNGRELSFFADSQEVEDRNTRNLFGDWNDTPGPIEEGEQREFDTPLSTLKDCDGQGNQSLLPSSFSNNKSDVNENEQKVIVDGIEVTAKTDIESPTRVEEPPLEQSTQPSNRLAELIELARKSFNDDTGRQLVDFLWSQPNDENNTVQLRPEGKLRRPHSVYELSSSEKMNGYGTLPTRGSSGNYRRKASAASDIEDSVNSEKSAWYKEMYKICHQIKPEEIERTVSYRAGEATPTMSNQRPITPQQARLEQQQNEQLLFEQQQRRARSVGRYDPVADMEILDHWSRQRAQFMREQNERPKKAMEALQIACSPSLARQTHSPVKNPAADRIASTANSYAITRSQTQHFHLPSYRFVHEDPRPILSPKSCFRCGKDRRDYTWEEIEALYQMMDKTELGKEIKKDRIGNRVKLRFIENRLEETANDLQKVIDQLETFGKTRSKSNPEIAWKLRNSNGKFNYLTGQQPSTSKGILNGSPNPLTRGINEMKKMTMEEILQRQRAEKLSEELDDQKNRRHGYFPGASPALQNNIQRFDHLLYNNVGNNTEVTNSRCSTPARRGGTYGPIQTCTVLYKFIAQTPKELSLNRGDVVRVHREIDSNWLEGERNGHVGIFPSSYVQMDEDPSTSRNKVRALYPFQARNNNELSLKKGEILRKRREIDPNWFEGTNSKGQIGIFPKCYVQNFIDGTENGEDDVSSVIPDRPKTPKTVTTNLSSRTVSPSSSKKGDRSYQIQQWEQRRDNFGFSGPAKIVPKNSQTYRALYPYKPEHSDELELQENDIVFVVEKCDDGWYIGTLLRTGQFGTFPGNYVEKH